MKALSAKNQTDTAARDTRPITLMELGFSSPLRLSTGGGLSWDGVWWNASGASAKQAGAGGAEIVLPNHDNSMSALVLGEGVKQKSARVVQLYGSGPWATEDGVQLFSGVMDEVSEIGAFVRIRCFPATVRTAFAPRLFFGPPLCNHIPPAGTVIAWGNDNFTLDRR